MCRINDVKVSYLDYKNNGESYNLSYKTLMQIVYFLYPLIEEVSYTVVDYSWSSDSDIAEFFGGHELEDVINSISIY